LCHEGPIYRPPSEADSLLIQATVGCPHNKCTFCVIYKKGPRFRIRPVREICEEIAAAWDVYGKHVKTPFFPSGNTIAMPAGDLVAICRYSRQIFPELKRITVYGSSHYLNLSGNLPADRPQLLDTIERALAQDESCFRPHFIGTQ
jgi:radical SAM superfamily enzyme YgiQ (UPF0313 family)